jgi:short-subunit dehydrogenase
MAENPKTILITGASSGLGAALALDYASAETNLALVGRNAVRLEKVAQECIARGAVVRTAIIDVRDAVKMAEFIIHIDELHPIDLVIANAGISAGTFGGEKNFDAAQGVFDVNVDGVLNTIHPIIPRMTKRRAGQIAIISSLAGILPWPGAAAYSASKAAVRYYGEALRGQLKRYGVSVSVVCPGWIHTPLVAVNKFPMPLIMSAERAAGIIRRGISQKKTRIAFPRSLYFMLRCVEALPVFITNPLSSLMPSKPHRS